MFLGYLFSFELWQMVIWHLSTNDRTRGCEGYGALYAWLPKCMTDHTWSARIVMTTMMCDCRQKTLINLHGSVTYIHYKPSCHVHTYACMYVAGTLSDKQGLRRHYLQ